MGIRPLGGALSLFAVLAPGCVGYVGAGPVGVGPAYAYAASYGYAEAPARAPTGGDRSSQGRAAACAGQQRPADGRRDRDFAEEVVAENVAVESAHDEAGEGRSIGGTSGISGR